MRNEFGIWKGAFEVNLGVASNIAAKLWGIIHGLQLAWEAGHKRVIVEVDLKAAIMLLDKSPELSPYSNLLNQIDRWRHKKWKVKISHIWREENNSANCLVKDNLNNESGLYCL